MQIATEPEELFRRYQELQRYVGWTDADARRLLGAGPIVAPYCAALIDDFYEEIERHPVAAKVITGRKTQIERLKGTLREWIKGLFTGRYDADYVARRWRVGRRHAEIGLEQVYTNVALSRLRSGMVKVLNEHWPGDQADLRSIKESLNKLLDLDLATIEDAYQAEYIARQQRSERLAAIGQVAGGIAHELRNPLNVIKTSVYYLLNARDIADEKKAEHLQRIDRHVLLADGVITALSNFARLPVPNMRAFPIQRCLQEALEANPLPQNCQLMLDCPDNMPPVLVDIDQIRIVFGNLLRNAREAMPQGGQLAVKSRQVEDGVETEISDTGVGIPADLLNRIMEPLYSTKARGLGLGLAIARAILEKNKGSLHVVSEPGQGSTFTVRLAAVLHEEHPQP
jgi:signal transduction histidine kinase